VILGVGASCGIGEPAPTISGSGAGTATLGATPALPISTEPSGIPGRGTPPGVSGVIGVADAATGLEPAGHPPDVTMPVVALGEGDAVLLSPPPSKVVLKPTFADGADADGTQVVPLPVIVAPVGLVVVPAGLVTNGLTPAEGNSVEPSGIPTGPTGEPDVMPSGDVAAILGSGGGL